MADLQKIHEHLFAPGGNLLLLVNGEGIVGKTSLASRYFHEYQYEYAHVAWILSEKSIANALLLLALHRDYGHQGGNAIAWHLQEHLCRQYALEVQHELLAVEQSQLRLRRKPLTLMFSWR